LAEKKKFIEKLDTLFSTSSDLTGEDVSSDITGLIGQYAHGNEPSHHITHMYNYVGQSMENAGTHPTKY
jgi:putative alpha-1,2-mannosidase